MHQIINAGDEYPESVIVHRHGTRETGRRYLPETLEGDSRLKKAVDGIEGQLAALRAENELLRARSAQYDVSGAVVAHIVDDSTLDVHGVRFVRDGACDA